VEKSNKKLTSSPPSPSAAGAGSGMSISSFSGIWSGMGATGGRAASPSALTCSTYFGGSRFFLSCSNSSFCFLPHSAGGRALPRAMLGGFLTSGFSNRLRRSPYPLKLIVVFTQLFQNRRTFGQSVGRVWMRPKSWAGAGWRQPPPGRDPSSTPCFWPLVFRVRAVL